MDRARLAFALAAAMLAAGVSAAPFECDAKFAARHGITCYIPFEDTGAAQFTRTRAAPTYSDSLHFVPGRAGRAVLLRKSREREIGKTRGRASGLNFDATGLLYGERGAIAFWFQPQWDGGDPTIRSGSNSTGPSLIAVSSVEPTYFRQFIRMQIKGGAFYIWVVDATGKWHGPNYGAQVKTWRKGEWRHLALTWDCGKGVRFFDNGRLACDTWGKERWPPATPSTIGIGSGAPSGRPETVRAADMVMDELFMFDRGLDAADVRALMSGDYARLRAARKPAIAAAERSARLKRFCLAPSPGRAAARSTESGWAARVELVEIRDIAVDYMEGRFLSDGLTTRRFHLAQGGLKFERDVRLVAAPGSAANYVLLVGTPTKGSALKTFEHTMMLAAGPDEAQRIILDPPAAEMTLSLKGGSSVGECQLFRIDGNVGPSDLQPLCLHEDPTVLGAAPTPLWRNSSSLDRRCLTPSGSSQARTVVPWPAAGKLHLMSSPADRDMAVQAIRLRLRLRRPPRAAALTLKVHDPFEANRFRLLVDLALPQTKVDEPALDLELLIPGLILGKEQRLWIEAVADSALEAIVGPDASGMRIESGRTGAAADAFARSYLRFLNQEFRVRMAHNFKYYSRGVQRVNPLTIGLGNVLRFAPESPRAQRMLHWARLSPWPKWTEGPPGPESAPRWAKLQRAAIAEALGTIHWWIDHRQDATGFVIGNADQWNDVTKLFNEFAVFALVTGDEKLTAAMERYLDAHYATGRMEKGYSKPLTDTVHSQEEASYLLPTLAVLRYGDPVQVERLMENAGNIPYWTGLVGPGRRHFKSSYYTATRMKTEGKFGHDVPMNAATFVPATFLAGYSGHPIARQWSLEYANAWCAASAAPVAKKPAGLPPSHVDYKTGALGPFRHSYYKTLGFHLLAATEFADDRKYLAPLEALLAHSKDRGVYSLGLNAIEWRRMTVSSKHDAAIMKQVQRGWESIEADSFFQRGVEAADVYMVLGYMITGDVKYLELGLLNAWRNNARARTIYTEIDPDTDRVYPWGRVVLPWMMCGGNGLNARASAPLPTIAVSWERTGGEMAAWVKEQSSRRLRVLVYNFGPARQVQARTWRLDPGEYRLTCCAERGGKTLWARSVRVRRGLPIAVDVPTQQLCVLMAEQTRVERLPERLPDAALSQREIAGGSEREADGTLHLRVPVHNIGTGPVPQSKLVVVGADGRVLAEAVVPRIPGADDMAPKVHVVEATLAAGVRVPIKVEVLVAGEEITKTNNSCSLPATQ